MIAIPSLVSTPTALALTPSTLATTPADIASTRITQVAPPAPLANLQVNNDTASKTPAAVTAATTATTQNSNSNEANSSSSGFLAQLYGQDDDTGTIALTTSLARFSPAPTYDTLVEYGYVKYKPSYAGLPQSKTPSSAQTNTTSVTRAAASNLQAYNVTQSRNQSNLSSVPDSQLTIAS